MPGAHLTRARPAGRDATAGGKDGVARSSDTVELQVPAATLAGWADQPGLAAQPGLGKWTPVVADLVARVHRLTADADTEADTEGHLDPFAADATRRLPGAALRRHLQIRDRTCRFPGCWVPARSADADHTHDHAHGGATSQANVGHACRHDHRLKHEGGWSLHQPEPGVFDWTSRLGARYRVRPPPIIDQLPEPVARDRPPYPVWLWPDYGWAESRILPDPPPEPEPAPPLPPAPDLGPPPF